jgi:hypothetical protein
MARARSTPEQAWSGQLYTAAQRISDRCRLAKRAGTYDERAAAVREAWPELWAEVERVCALYDDRPPTGGLFR